MIYYSLPGFCCCRLSVDPQAVEAIKILLQCEALKDFNCAGLMVKKNRNNVTVTVQVNNFGIGYRRVAVVIVLCSFCLCFLPCRFYMFVRINQRICTVQT